MLRVLQIVTKMDRCGLETLLMNYYRNIDRSKVQFDFLTHREERGQYDDEIEQLGGNIYHVPHLNPLSSGYYKALDDFFRTHPYNIVHSHLDCTSTFPLRAAKKAGVPYRIAHIHSTSQDKDFKYPIKMLSKKMMPYYDYTVKRNAERKPWLKQVFITGLVFLSLAGICLVVYFVI